MKPETLAAGIHRPSLLPIAHLKKYTEDNGCTIGPHFIGCFRDKQAERGSCESTAKRTKRDRDTSSSQSDFMALGTVDVESDTKDLNYKELVDAIAELKEENNRWRSVCKQLKSGLSSTSNS